MEAEVSDDLVQQRVKVRRRMRGVATFFIVISIIGLLGSVAAFLTGRSEFDEYELFALAIIVFGMLLSAVSAWHGSRVAALVLLLFLALTPLSAVMQWDELDPPDWVRSALYISLAVWMLTNSVRYHRLSRQFSESIGGLSWLRWSAKLVSASLLLFIGFGFAVLSVGVSSSIIKGADMTEEQLIWLFEQGYLTNDERPLYLNLDGAFSIAEGGSLLTNTYVGGWWQEDGEQRSVWIKLGEICQVKTLKQGDLFEPAVYSVHSPGDELWVELWLSVENDQHDRFMSRMKTINNRKKRPEVQAFCDQNRAIDWDEIAAANGISRDIIHGADVSEAHRLWLAEQQFLLDQEQILEFFSYGRFSIAEGGALLTESYFGGWWESSGEVQGWWANIGEICDITIPETEDADISALYRVSTSDGDWVDLSLPTKNNQGAQLAQRVLEMNARAETDEHRVACQAAESTE